MKTSETKLKENGYTNVLINTYFEERIYSKEIEGNIIRVFLLSDNTFKISYVDPHLITEPRLHLLLAKEIKKLRIEEND